MAGELAASSASLSKTISTSCSPDGALTAEKTLESSRWSKLSRAFNRARGVCGGCGTIERGGKSHFPEQSPFLYSFCVRKSEIFQQKTGKAAVAGELAASSASLSKTISTGCSPDGASAFRAGCKRVRRNAAAFTPFPHASAAPRTRRAPSARTYRRAECNRGDIRRFPSDTVCRAPSCRDCS